MARNTTKPVAVIAKPATRTAAQQKAIDEMRAAKAATREQDAADAWAAQQSADAVIKPTVIEVVEAEDKEVSAFNHALGTLMEKFGIASFKRYFCALIASMFTSFGVGYLGGMVTSVLYMALASSGWAFLSYIVLVVGIVLSIYAGVKAGQIVFNYIGLRQIDAHAAVIGSFIKGSWNAMFSSSDTKPVAAAA